MASELSVEISTRHQVLLERLKSQKANEFIPYLRRIDRVMREVMSRQPENMNNRQLNAALAELKEKQTVIYNEFITEFLDDGEALAESEAAFEARTLGAVTGEGVAIEQATAIYSQVKKAPLSVRGPAGGKLLEPFIKDWSKAEIAAVNNMVRQGVGEGQTVPQIIRNIRGSSGNKFQDGLFAKVNRESQAAIRTAVQHMSSQARQQTAEANEDILEGVEWISTLDSRTTQQCRSLDGKIFPVDSGPRPPIHIGCRSSVVPSVKPEFDLDIAGERPAVGSTGRGPVDGDITYYDWLQNQSEAFQDQAIGPTRGQLLRDGGLTSKQFADLNLNSQFEPMTLKEMQAVEPLAFERAGLT